MEYIWNFTEVEVYPTMTKDNVEYSDVLHTIHWTYTASEGDDSQTHIDRLQLGLGDMAGFVPYSELDRATVISWIAPNILSEEIAIMQTALAKCITDRKTVVPATSEIRTIEE
tara:strand:+ start:503 stop:841 length:339 start_codon:yes stop_codon:yes gene_type:complete